MSATALVDNLFGVFDQLFREEVAQVRPELARPFEQMDPEEAVATLTRQLTDRFEGYYGRSDMAPLVEARQAQDLPASRRRDQLITLAAHLTVLESYGLLSGEESADD